jgi:hypothetical protein
MKRANRIKRAGIKEREAFSFPDSVKLPFQM